MHPIPASPLEQPLKPDKQISLISSDNKLDIPSIPSTQNPAQLKPTTSILTHGASNTSTTPMRLSTQRRYPPYLSHLPTSLRKKNATIYSPISSTKPLHIPTQR